MIELTTAKVKQGTNLEDVMDMNRSLIIKLMRKRGICSRAELAHESGLNQSTITNIINEMIGWGLVVETGVIDGKKGRRSIGIKLNSELYKVIGIRLARKMICVGLYDVEGNVFGFKQLPINRGDGPEAAFNKMKELVAETIKNNAIGKVIAIGVATPGPLFRNEGRIVLMSHFPGWEKINIQEELMSMYGIPVYVEHDAKAGGLAEWWFGERNKDQGTLIYVAAGEGVGAGIVVDGTLFRGSLGMAGEIGHMSINFNGPKCECGHKGCLELYGSTSAILKELSGQHSSLPSIWSALNEGNPAVQEVVKQAAWYLAFGLVNIVNCFNPNRIILGDEFSGAGELLLDTVRKVIDEYALPDVSSKIIIELEAQNEDFMLMGAAAIAIENILIKPSLYLSCS
ncbi:ROK family transcriptional regulator [Paenibacillus pectinilyticus]|uniref:ROK family transcriptional regulator n=1 Tax=Paenibacillus pectinilyticus TaxID=512399 RepID=UPI003CC6C15B